MCDHNHMTDEDWDIWARLGRYARSCYQRSDSDDYWHFRNYGDCDRFYLVNAVKAEAYAADMYGTPDYSDVEAA